VRLRASDSACRRSSAGRRRCRRSRRCCPRTSTRFLTARSSGTARAFTVSLARFGTGGMRLLIGCCRGAEVDEGQPETQPPGFLGVWKRGESVGSCVYYLSCYGIASDMASLWNRGLFLLQLEMLTNDLALRIVCVSSWLFARLTCFPVWTFELSFLGFNAFPFSGFNINSHLWFSRYWSINCLLFNSSIFFNFDF
jgi:hypothetical protein